MTWYTECRFLPAPTCECNPGAAGSTTNGGEKQSGTVLSMIGAISAVTLGTHEMGPNNRRAAGPICLRYFDPVSALQRHIKADAAPTFSATTIHSGIPVRCVYNFFVGTGDTVSRKCARKGDGRSGELQRTCHPIPLLSISFRFCGPLSMELEVGGLPLPRSARAGCTAPLLRRNRPSRSAI